MLTGEYNHNIDDKGRMNFPSKLREELGVQFYVTSWFDDCLAVFSEEEFQIVRDKIVQQSMTRSRDIQRWLASSATTVEPDKQGRILIPTKLREKAGIGTEVTVIGVFNRAEIWDRKKWAAQSETMDAEAFDQKMSELEI